MVKRPSPISPDTIQRPSRARSSSCWRSGSSFCSRAAGGLSSAVLRTRRAAGTKSFASNVVLPSRWNQTQSSHTRSIVPTGPRRDWSPPRPGPLSEMTRSRRRGNHWRQGCPDRPQCSRWCWSRGSCRPDRPNLRRSRCHRADRPSVFVPARIVFPVVPSNQECKRSAHAPNHSAPNSISNPRSFVQNDVSASYRPAGIWLRNRSR